MLRSQRGTIVVVATAVIALLAAASAVFLLLPARTVSGRVVDATGGLPPTGAAVRAAGQEYPVGEDGSFGISGLRLGSTVVAEARGYVPASAVVAFGNQLLLTLEPRVLDGLVRDARNGTPVAGARLSAGDLAVQSDGEGRFRLVGLDPGAEIEVAAAGFGRLLARYDGQPSVDLALSPNVATLRVLDRYTGEPVAGAEAAVVSGSAGVEASGERVARTDEQGRVTLRYLPERAEVTVRREGFAPAKVVFDGQATADVLLRPDTVAGVVRDEKGRLVAGAVVASGGSTATTDAEGSFRLSGLPESARLAVSANGYERRLVEVGQGSSVEVRLKPFAAKGLYLTYYGVGSADLREQVLKLADTTEVNAVVIDVKGDRGWIAYRSAVPMVNEIGAQQGIMIQDPRRFLDELNQRGVYTIARIVVFKDKPLSTSRPDLAVMNSETGRPWVDNEGLTWADPTRQEVWDYNIALATEAIELGFDEVQFDYVRFPTDASAGNSLSSISFSLANTEANRMAAINGFLEKAREAIHAKGGVVSADIFGYVVWRNDDMGIGQKLEELAERVDYVSPMVYPNLFWDGIPAEGGAMYGGQRAGLYPYEIVYESMKIAAQRIGAEKLRPWLQYYDDYLTGKSYGAAEIEAQKRATYENGIAGWLFWDPTNRFDKGGFASE
ncbi:MAG: putative glycoside hydrolase [Sphingomonadaceae bacterium]